ncbi:MAG TPA: glycoside hydrolase family 13 protein [Candidatus Excrementavichristensenella intestinipullorum]|nr:glycoside hydrolase family 13 protein [Candidatus Excrementavichristensenella intestinipullorum]
MLHHDSRHLMYRTPAGPGACGAPVTLRLKAHPPVEKVTLRLWWQDAEKLLPMQHAGDGLWTVDFTLPDTPGTLWYYFIADSGLRRMWYGNATDRMGGVGGEYPGEPPSYQITVYDPAYDTPHWMRDGLMYQIMVDRFAQGRPLSQHPQPDDGWLHQDWYEYPALRLDGEDNEANDFFGGDLAGVMEKLPYLKQLGVTVLYFNPIFRARSNHKYDTGDYMAVDPSFGDEADFAALCRAAEELGIRVVLDGVFSHTGADSRYFNIKGRYDSLGAYQSIASPYAGWYTFDRWPDKYDCWWGFPTLPNVREMSESYLDFMLRDEDAVCAHWLRAGSSGWRLDVADELPMPFLRMLRQRVKKENPDACLLGEVWEDASNKLTYGELRNYCVGDTLDSVMNYPLRDMSLDFMLGKLDSPAFVRRYLHLQENYAPAFFYSLMNLLGSHDKPRIIDVLSGNPELDPPREERRVRALTPQQYQLGRRRYLALWRFICALPGMPCIYYADEAGQTGMADPFCRATYPWGREDKDLVRRVGAICRERMASDVLRTGEMRLYAPLPHVLVAARRIQGGRDLFGNPAQDGLALCALNRSPKRVKLRLNPDRFLPQPVELTLAPESARTLWIN